MMYDHKTKPVFDKPQPMSLTPFNPDDATTYVMKNPNNVNTLPVSNVIPLTALSPRGLAKLIDEYKKLSLQWTLNPCDVIVDKVFGQEGVPFITFCKKFDQYSFNFLQFVLDVNKIKYRIWKERNP